MQQDNPSQWREVPYLRVDFGQKEQTSQINGSFAGKRPRGMLEGGSLRTVGEEPPFAAMLVDRNLFFVKRRTVARMNVLCARMVNEVFSDHRRWAWVEHEVTRIWSAKSELKGADKMTFAPHYLFGLFLLISRSLNHLVYELERCESL